MKSNVFGFALLSAAAIVANAPAQAQNGSLTRSFVSSSGSDTNPCTIAQPCQSFAVAYTKISANGIIAALDPGKYGAITITGPVTINGNGWAAITGTSGNDAIDITAVSGNVTLIGLELDGADAGKHGIFLTSALTGTAALIVRDCVVSNFTDSGIAIQPSAGTMFASIVNSYSQYNGINGINIAPSGNGAVNFVIDQTTVNNNFSDGFAFSANATNGSFIAGSLPRSQSNYNQITGISILGSNVTIKNCYVALNNSYGISVSHFGILYLSGTDLNLNVSYGIIVDSSATAYTSGDNNIYSSNGTLTNLPLQ
jgi:hypothetical protein